MTRRWLWFFAKVAVLVAAAVWLVRRPGTVSIEWMGWQVEMRLAVLALAVLVLMALAVGLYRVWRALLGGPGLWRRGRASGRKEKGYRALNQGLVAVAAGDADSALKHARKAEALLDGAPLALLLSAQAAQLQGDEGAAERFFQAMLAGKETAFLGHRGLLTQALKRGDRSAALEHARQAQALQPKAEWPASAVVELEAAGGNWLAAEAALDKAQRAKAINPDLARRRRAALLVEECRADLAAGRVEEALQDAQKAHDLYPASVPAAVHLAKLRVRSGNPKAASRAIEQAWALSPHPELADAWMDVADTQDPIAKVKRAEALVALDPKAADAHVALARAGMEARLWGLARTHLETARTLAPTARIYRLLAELARAEHGDGPQARTWQAMLAGATPDPAWVCGSCGTQSAQGWVAVCPHCGGFDTLAWTTPGPALRLAAQTDDGPTALFSPTARPVRPLLPQPGG